MIRILTYNTWHGLTGAGTITIGELESAERRELRWQMQSRNLKFWNFDVVGLQEVNPLGPKMNDLGRDLDRNWIATIDNEGIKIGGVGLPLNLSSGLGLLFPKHWELLQAEEWLLSGQKIQSSHRVLMACGADSAILQAAKSLRIPLMDSLSSGWCLQWQEARKALAVRVRGAGIEWLFVNLHLHHKLEWTSDLEKNLLLHFAKWKNPEVLAILKSKLAEGDLRRASELTVLLENLKRLVSEFHSIERIVLMGDFNASPQSEVAQRLTKEGFLDLGSKLETPSPTWTAEENGQNHRYLEGFHFAHPIEDLDVSESQRGELREVLLKQECLPRRIDQIWVKAHASASVDFSHMTCWIPRELSYSGLQKGSDHLPFATKF